jgi:hypothetical protein
MRAPCCQRTLDAEGDAAWLGFEYSRCTARHYTFIVATEHEVVRKAIAAVLHQSELCVHLTFTIGHRGGHHASATCSVRGFGRLAEAHLELADSKPTGPRCKRLQRH